MARMDPKFIRGLGLKDFIHQRGNTILSKHENEFTQSTIQKKIVEEHFVNEQGEAIVRVKKHFFNWFNKKTNRELIKNELKKNTEEVSFL